MLEKLDETLGFLRNRGIATADTGIVLGTGLGKLIDEMHIAVSIDYGDIPHFPVSTVESHRGRLLYGELCGRRVLAMQGRFHYYEGYSLEQITFPIRVMKMLGIENLLLSNAAGSMNPKFPKGSLMLIDDHINFLPGNPLRGMNYEELGPRFPDMSRPYSPRINTLFREAAASLGFDLKEGVYVAVMGPNLETRAEYRMFRDYADAVGMSTVPEVIVANHMQLPCSAISVITDECDPDNLHPVALKDILEAAAIAEKDLIKLYLEVIPEL